MNKRLIWSFEINTEIPLKLSKLPLATKDELRWESRFFWPDNHIIGNAA